MANKRMLARSVTDDDRFSSMSSSAQALYLHLSMCADDDGFCNQVSICMFRAHASVSDLETLLERRYLYQFDNGVIVIKHWRMANALRKDRYTPTNFQKELAMLTLDDIGNYHLQGGCQVVAERLPDGCQVVATDKNRLDKSRVDKGRVDKGSVGEHAKRFTPPTVEEVAAYVAERKSPVDPQGFIDFYESKGWMVGKNKMKDWQAACRNAEKWDRWQKAPTTKPLSFTDLTFDDEEVIYDP